MILHPLERYWHQRAIGRGIELGIEQGIEQGRFEIAKNMLDEGISIEMIIKYTELSREDILSIE